MQETIGQRIRYLRKLMKLTQQQLGDLVGVTKAAISQWELDQNNTFEENKFDALLQALNTTKEYLKSGDKLYSRSEAPTFIIKEQNNNGYLTITDNKEIKAILLMRDMTDFQQDEWITDGESKAEEAKKFKNAFTKPENKGEL